MKCEGLEKSLDGYNRWNTRYETLIREYEISAIWMESSSSSDLRWSNVLPTTLLIVGKAGFPREAETSGQGTERCAQST